eukprot:gene4165-5214_t
MKPQQSNNQQQLIIPVKLVMIGPANAGKTSLVLRLVKDTFQNESIPTVGAMFLNKFFSFDNYTIKFEIWDTAGQEKFHSLAPMYFRGAEIAVVVFDISDPESFLKAKSWVREFRSHSTQEATMVLIANKCDLNRVVPKEDAENYAKEEGMMFFEASAKLNTNLLNIFQNLASKVKIPPSPNPNQKPNQSENSNSTVSLSDPKDKPKKKCCR